MTCREVMRLLKQDERDNPPPFTENDALALHVQSCRRCSEAMKVVTLSSTLFQALRDETQPGPWFYPRLRARFADAQLSRPDTDLLHALGLARRVIPALAMGVLLLVGMTLSTGGSQSASPVQVRDRMAVDAFSLEEVNLPGVVGEPSRDQMLAFVLAQNTLQATGSARTVDPTPAHSQSGK